MTNEDWAEVFTKWDNYIGADTFTNDAQLEKDSESWWSVPFVSANLVLGYREDLLKESGYDAPASRMIS